MTRIVEPSQIPLSLWNVAHPASKGCASGCIHLPSRFCDAYRNLLHRENLIDRAEEPEDGEEGGATGAEDEGGASEHFARRFDGSSARTQLYALDPRNEYATTSDGIFSLFSGGSVRLLDIPIGAGSASALIISVVAQLRNENILPRNPIDIIVHGGDIDKNAILYSKELFKDLKSFWIENAINVSLETFNWDAQSDEQTGDLLDAWSLGAQPEDICAVVIANFSGFLWKYDDASGKRAIDEVSSNIRQILVRTGKLSAPLFWIESQRKQAGQMFKWIEDNLGKKFSRITPAFPNSRTAKSAAKSPVKNGAFFTTRSQGIHWHSIKP